MSTTRKPQMSAAEFVKLWQTQGPQAFVALGYQRSATMQRAKGLREKGVTLKEWPTTRGLDIAALQKIAEEALSSSAESLDDTETSLEMDTEGDASDV